jgi:hypothetical protein
MSESYIQSMSIFKAINEESQKDPSISSHHVFSKEKEKYSAKFYLGKGYYLIITIAKFTGSIKDMNALSLEADIFYQINPEKHAIMVKDSTEFFTNIPSIFSKVLELVELISSEDFTEESFN